MKINIFTESFKWYHIIPVVTFNPNTYIFNFKLDGFTHVLISQSFRSLRFLLLFYGFPANRKQNANKEANIV